MDDREKEIEMPLKKPSAKHNKNLARFDTDDPQVGSSLSGSYCYILKGIASLQNSIIGIYFLFFKSAYNKNIEKYILTKDKKTQREKNLSQFYKAFIEYMCITSTIGTTDPTKVESKVDQFKKQLYLFKDDPYLLDITIKLAQYHFKNLRKYLERDQKDSMGELYLELKGRYQSIRTSLLQEEKLKQILKNQYLPAEIYTIEQVEQFINRTFLRLQNIYSPQTQKRMDLLQRFCSEMKPVFKISLPYFESKKYKGLQKFKNCIIINRTSNIDDAFLTSYDQYLSFQSILTNTLGPAKDVLAKDVFLLIRDFYNNAKLAYPYLRIQDLIFNQKSLKPQLRQSSLIYEGLGLHKNTNSIQVELSVNSTPSPIEFQKCYKQFDKDFIWSFEKKYYCPSSMVQIQQQQQQQIQQQLAISELYQNVDVWRLLCILYYTFHNKQHYVKKKYNDKYRKIFVTQKDENPPFYYDRYQQLLKELYQNVRNDPIQIKQMLTNQQINNNKQVQIASQKQVSPHIQQSNFQFNFTMRQVQEFMNIQNTEDSLIQKLQFQSIKQQFYVRYVLGRQILGLVVHQRKFFAKMFNVKKYVIMFNLAIIISVYETVFLIWSQQNKKGSRMKIIKNMKQFRTINFQKQEKTRRIEMQNCIKKIGQYNKRHANDQQRRYLKTNEFITNNFQLGYKDYLKLIQKSNELSNYEISMTIMSKDQESKQIKQVKQVKQTKQTKQEHEKKMNQIQQIAKKTINNAYKCMNIFLQQDIIQKSLNINELHKLDESTSKSKKNEKIYMLMTQKLIICIQSFLKLTTKNWREYQFFLLGHLIDQKKSAVNRLIIEKDKSQDPRLGQVEALQRSLEIAREFISLEDEVTNYDQLKYINGGDFKKYNQA